MNISFTAAVFLSALLSAFLLPGISALAFITILSALTNFQAPLLSVADGAFMSTALTPAPAALSTHIAASPSASTPAASPIIPVSDFSSSFSSSSPSSSAPAADFCPPVREDQTQTVPAPLTRRDDAGIETVSCDQFKVSSSMREI